MTANWGHSLPAPGRPDGHAVLGLSGQFPACFFSPFTYLPNLVCATFAMGPKNSKSIINLET